MGADQVVWTFAILFPVIPSEAMKLKSVNGVWGNELRFFTTRRCVISQANPIPIALQAIGFKMKPVLR